MEARNARGLFAINFQYISPGSVFDFRLSLNLLTTVQLADMSHLAAHDATGRRKGLSEFLKGLYEGLPQLSDAISHHYLSHLQVSRQLASGGGT